MPTTYIIDTSALVRMPEILERSGKTRIVFPEGVVAELEQSRVQGKRNLAALVREASDQGAVIGKLPPNFRSKQSLSSLSRRLSPTDIEIVFLALHYAASGSPDDVRVVTYDKQIIEALSAHGIGCLSAEQFLEKADNEINRQLQVGVQSLRAEQYHYLRTTIISLAVAVPLCILIVRFFDLIVGTLLVWGTVFALAILATGLFIFRQRNRLGYGVMEVLAGLGLGFSVFYPAFDYSKLSALQYLQALGGVYVVVRGLDNIGTGIENSAISHWWPELFRGRV
ncbi:MAG: PIN domain-containing protein [Planctomycetota bacterium]